MSYVRGANPVWYEVDLTGHSFDDTFYMFVLENVFPYVPAEVYHNADATTPWTQPIRFLANGTLPTDIFFNDASAYRLEFRKGDTQADPLIYLIENYRPGAGVSPIDTVALASSNQITNPQFVDVDFAQTFTVSTTDLVMQIAPGWFLELGGTGFVAVERIAVNDTVKTPSNAPYLLHLVLSGWNANECFLRQRFEQNGMLWANKIVSTAVTASITGSPQDISASLVDSNDQTLAVILDPEPLSGAFEEYKGQATLPDTTNPDFPPSAYIDYKLKIPSNGDIYLTSFQVVVQELPIEPSFEQDTVNRQIDHTFNYYKDPLSFKPVSSFLVGWDFPLNPAQFGENYGPQAVGANKSYYVWDQTIVFQEANSGLIVAREANIGALSIQATVSGKHAIIQYLPAKDADEVFAALVLDGVSSNIVMESTVPQEMTLSLYWTAASSISGMSAGDSLVTGFDGDGYPVVSGGWIEVKRGKFGKSNFTVGGALSLESHGFSNFNDADAYNTAKFFAIVLSTKNNLASGNVVEYKSVSLVPGIIPTIPAPQTSDEVLRESKYYYRKSYNANIPPGTASISDGALNFIQPSSGSSTIPAISYAGAFDVRFDVDMHGTPSVKIYSPVSGTLNAVYAQILYHPSVGADGEAHDNSYSIGSQWAQNGISEKGFSYIPIVGALAVVNSGVNAEQTSAYIRLHYEADARLGF